MSERYNGWTNCETWLVNLWIDNDRGTQDYFREQADVFYQAAAPSKLWTQAENATFRFAEYIQEHHEANMPELPSVYGDLLGGALGAVNWQEIAKHHIDAVLEEDSNATS
jgi:hypothetical protein